MGWKIGGGICSVMTVAGIIVAATTEPEYATPAQWVVAALFAALAVYFFWKGSKKKKGVSHSSETPEHTS